MLVLTGATGEITAVTVWEENIVTTQKKCTCLLEGGGGGGGGGGWLAGGRLRCRLHRATAGAPRQIRRRSTAEPRHQSQSLICLKTQNAPGNLMNSKMRTNHDLHRF